MPDEPLSDNAALNRMVDTLEATLLLVQGAYDSIEGDESFQVVEDSLLTLREEETHALKTVVSNGGANSIEVYQDDILTMIVPPGESRELPLASYGEIKAKCGSALESLVAIATYKQTVV